MSEASDIRSKACPIFNNCQFSTIFENRFNNNKMAYNNSDHCVVCNKITSENNKVPLGNSFSNTKISESVKNYASFQRDYSDCNYHSLYQQNKKPPHLQRSNLRLDVVEPLYQCNTSNNQYNTPNSMIVSSKYASTFKNNNEIITYNDNNNQNSSIYAFKCNRLALLNYPSSASALHNTPYNLTNKKPDSHSADNKVVKKNLFCCKRNKTSVNFPKAGNYTQSAETFESSEDDEHVLTTNQSNRIKKMSNIKNLELSKNTYRCSNTNNNRNNSRPQRFFNGLCNPGEKIKKKMIFVLIILLFMLAILACLPAFLVWIIVASKGVYLIYF